MNYLGIDYGEKRVGLAYADEVGIALPLPAAVEPTQEARLKHIGEQIDKRRIGVIVVGYPYNMDGSVGFKAKEVDAFIAELERRFPLPIHRIDERLSSQQASADLAASGKKKPRTIKQRQAERRTGELDSRAAALILREYLEQHAPALLPEEEEDY